MSHWMDSRAKPENLEYFAYGVSNYYNLGRN